MTPVSFTARLLRLVRAKLGLRLRAEPRIGEPGPRPVSSSSPPPSSSVRDPVLAGYYANLEVPYGADLETVHQAWKRLLRQCHPDLHSADPERQRLGTELVKRLNHAYGELRKLS